MDVLAEVRQASRQAGETVVVMWGQRRVEEANAVSSLTDYRTAPSFALRVMPIRHFIYVRAVSGFTFTFGCSSP